MSFSKNLNFIVICNVKSTSIVIENLSFSVYTYMIGLLWQHIYYTYVDELSSCSFALLYDSAIFSNVYAYVKMCYKETFKQIPFIINFIEVHCHSW